MPFQKKEKTKPLHFGLAMKAALKPADGQQNADLLYQFLNETDGNFQGSQVYILNATLRHQ